MDIPYRNITDSDKQILTIVKRKYNKNKILKVLGCIGLFILAIMVFMTIGPNGAVGILLPIGLTASGVFLLIKVFKSNTIIGICETKVVKYDKTQSIDIDAGLNYEYLVTLNIPETNETIKKSVDSKTYLNAIRTGESYLLKTKNGDEKVFVFSKKEQLKIHKNDNNDNFIENKFKTIDSEDYSIY